jgi:hypothetical protein
MEEKQARSIRIEDCIIDYRGISVLSLAAFDLAVEDMNERECMIIFASVCVSS